MFACIFNFSSNNLRIYKLIFETSERQGKMKKGDEKVNVTNRSQRK